MARKASGAEQVELAQSLLRKAKSVEELRAAQAIVLPRVLGLSLKQTAVAIGRSVGATCTMRVEFGRTLAGETKATRSKRELRNRAKASLEREAQILDEVLSEAKTGGVVTVPPLKPAIEFKLGKTLALSTLYQMLSRHGWRKLVPDKSHPKADPAARDARKKTSRAAGRRSSGIRRRSSAQADVPGRGAFWPNQRCTPLLGQEAEQTYGSRHDGTTIHVRLWRGQPC